MNRFDDNNNLDVRFKSMNQKLSMTKEEQNDMLHEINQKIRISKSTTKKRSIPWKFYVTSAVMAVIFMIFITPLFNDTVKNPGSGENLNETHSSLQNSPQDRVTIEVINDTEIDIYGLELEIYQSEVLKVTQGASNADGSTVEKGESIAFEFLETDFHLVGEIDVEVVIVEPIEMGGERIPIDKFTLNLSNEREYLFEINGESASNLDVTIVDENQ
ncbi:hypothetical protein GMD78_14665 [Ornithinibacillus sp. L9]|uniref:Uncharacterized protein n=1 Tax=Ornithinibacillus caprae TaxID=2678566 RepID=A0A6N8FQ11_9BACI|nr:hypothetical protein [Ornithinibacillus caprae]MUK89608.1 hypothetical protein [Ornithinibacillus caprae]